MLLPRASKLLSEDHVKLVQCPSPIASAFAVIQEVGLAESQAKAFQVAKNALTSSSFLTHYDPDWKLVFDCDASPYGVGAVLSHYWKDGSTRPIAFASHSLNPAEYKYVQLDIEGLAIVYQVKMFHQYCLVANSSSTWTTSLSNTSLMKQNPHQPWHLLACSIGH